MKPVAIIILIILISFGCSHQFKNVEENSETNNSIQNTHDSVLAQKLGADDYGMKKYVVAFLKKGANTDQDSTKAAELQRAHLDNITRLANEGKLVLAGPFFGKGELRGIYIFNVETIEEAKKLTNSDPAIKAGRLKMELHLWYGSAALMQINELHNSIAILNP